MRWAICAALMMVPAVGSAQAPDAEDVLVEEDEDGTSESEAPAPDFVEGPQEVVDTAPSAAAAAAAAEGEDDAAEGEDDAAEGEDDAAEGEDAAAEGEDAAVEGEAEPNDAAEADDAHQPELKWSLRTRTSVFATDNRDYRALDERSDQAIRDSDDRRDFGHTDLLFSAVFDPRPDVELDIQLKYDALWADEHLGRTTGSTGDLNVFRLNFAWQAVDTPELGASLRFGRQPFSIGGVPRDYMLQGTLDAITAQVDLRSAGRLRGLLIDFFGGNDLPTVGYQAYKDGRETVFGLRGDTNTLRTGFIYELDDAALPELPLEVRAYYFFASIGGGPIEESGADITRGGKNGNFSDRDYQHLTGLRAAYVDEIGDGGSVRVYAEFARSEGLDRKEVEARDVATIGNAYGGGAEVEFPVNAGVTLLGTAEFYHFDGARYASDGLEFERGFVGFKGARVGGMTVGRHSAWRPSSHVDASGVIFHPHDVSRVAGTEFLHAQAGLDLWGTRLTVDWWSFTDTGATFLEADAIDEMPEPPFGYTREEFAAQARLGEALGQAIDFRVEQRLADDLITLHLGYGLFMPGRYYDIEVARLAGDDETALGGQETFWVFEFGAGLGF